MVGDDLKELNRIHLKKSDIKKIHTILGTSRLPLLRARYDQYLTQLERRISEQAGIPIRKVYVFDHRRGNGEINLACAVHAGVDNDAYLFIKGEER